jgi:hypothetical protein
MVKDYVKSRKTELEAFTIGGLADTDAVRKVAEYSSNARALPWPEAALCFGRSNTSCLGQPSVGGASLVGPRQTRDDRAATG